MSTLMIRLTDDPRLWPNSLDIVSCQIAKVTSHWKFSVVTMPVFSLIICPLNSCKKEMGGMSCEVARPVFTKNFAFSFLVCDKYNIYKIYRSTSHSQSIPIKKMVPMVEHKRNMTKSGWLIEWETIDFKIDQGRKLSER